MVFKGVMIVILMLTSCSYDTKIVCDYRWHHEMTMKQLDKKCDFIQHGSTSKWVLKKGKEYDK